MRRGLIEWNPEELPKAALEARIERVRESMQRAGLDAALFYTNLVRSCAVSWLTGFTPYWADAMLLVPKSGTPVFATALSKRVANWIASTNPVSEIVNTPKPGAAVGKRLAAAGCKRVGVLEFDTLPAGLYDEIAGEAPGVTLVDASAEFAGVRRVIDAPERGLIARADALAVAALEQIDVATARNAGAVAGLVEKHARLGSAEEAYIAVAADLAADRRLIRVARALPLAGRFAVRASVAYKGCWVRRTRSFAADAQGARAMAQGDAWLRDTIAAITPGKPFAEQIATRKAAGIELRAWSVDSCIGSYPLQTVASSAEAGREAPADGSFLVLTAELSIGGVPWLGAAPAFVNT